MTDLVGQIEIPSYNSYYPNRDKRSREYDDTIVDPNPIKDPDGSKLPPEIDPVESDLDNEIEPPLTPDEELDPSNNPVKSAIIGGRLWTQKSLKPVEKHWDCVTTC